MAFRYTIRQLVQAREFFREDPEGPLVPPQSRPEDFLTHAALRPRQEVGRRVPDRVDPPQFLRRQPHHHGLDCPHSGEAGPQGDGAPASLQRLIESSPITKETTMRPLHIIAQEAIEIQDACNLSGLATSFGRIAEELIEYHAGPDCIPILQLWISKLHNLCGLGLSDLDGYHHAYARCKELVAERPGEAA
jgi:hypothetical protein